MITATLVGVLTIHLCGIFYMILLAIFKHSGSGFIFGWILAQSGVKIIYDIIASFVLVLIGKYLHSGLKLLIE
jgi:biotin transporter BioY